MGGAGGSERFIPDNLLWWGTSFHAQGTLSYGQTPGAGFVVPWGSCSSSWTPAGTTSSFQARAGTLRTLKAQQSRCLSNETCA